MSTPFWFQPPLPEFEIDWEIVEQTENSLGWYVEVGDDCDHVVIYCPIGHPMRGLCMSREMARHFANTILEAAT